MRKNRLARNNGERNMKKLKPDRSFAVSTISPLKMLGLCCDDAHSGAVE